MGRLLHVAKGSEVLRGLTSKLPRVSSLVGLPRICTRAAAENFVVGTHDACLLRDVDFESTLMKLRIGRAIAL